MNGTDLQQAFGNHLSQFDDLLPLNEIEIFHWLTLAQEKIVSRSFTSFEQDQVISQIIRPLVCVSESEREETTVAGTHGYVEAHFCIPKDHQYTISISVLVQPISGWTETEEGIVAITEGEPSWSSCKLAQNDDVHRLLKDPFNRPVAWEPLITFGPKVARAYEDSTFSISRLRIEFLRKAKPVTRDCGTDLPDFVHNELVEQAVDLYSKSIYSSKHKLSP